MAQNMNIPMDVDKIAFIEDLFKFVTSRDDLNLFQQFGVEVNRESVPNRVNETIQNAINFMKHTTKFQRDIFFYIRESKAVNRGTSRLFVETRFQRYFHNGFNFTFHNVLPYCVHLALAATNFFDHGVYDARDTATSYILQAWKDYNMDAGGWNILNQTAERYLSMSKEQLTEYLESQNPEFPGPKNPENSARQNAAENVGNFSNEASTSADGLAKNEDSVEKSQKRSLQKEEESNVSKKFCSSYPEDMDT